MTNGATILGLLALASCQGRASSDDLPALLTNPTAESRAELARVVSAALNGAPVTLADEALTRESTLVIERATHRDAEGRPLDGRQRDRPERFHLVKNGSSCLLLQERTGRRLTLVAAACVPR